MSQTELATCPVCKLSLNSNESSYDHGLHIYYYHCPRCGDYNCTWNMAVNVIPKLTTSECICLSGSLRERYELGAQGNDATFVHEDNYESSLFSGPSQFDIASKVQKLLTAISRRTSNPSARVEFPKKISYPIAYAANDDEFLYLTRYAEEMHWVERSSTMHDVELRLTPLGWEQVQRRPRMESQQGFVAMWFDQSMDDAFINGIKPAIEADCHYRSRRIDAKEFNGDVVDELMAEIRESRFVVCDLTGHRNGVYFEAGFAMGIGIPTIWTCRDDEAYGTHFDAEHFNQIRWKTVDELRRKLAVRIRATIGQGPLQPIIACDG